MKFSCCIEMIYTSLPLTDRIAKAADAGFDYFEFWNWQEKDIDAIKRAIDKYGIKPASFQGSLNGVMVDCNDKEIYVKDVEKSIDLAKELGALAVFCISDILQEDRSVKPHPRPISEEEAFASSVDVLKTVSKYADKNGINIVIEPLNTLVDHAGYSLYSTKAGVDIIKAVDSPRVRLLYDAYHMQIMEGNIIDTIKQYHQYFGHFHVADVPGRHQPGTGELNYMNILTALKETGYQDIVGFEYDPVTQGESVENVLKAFKQI